MERQSTGDRRQPGNGPTALTRGGTPHFDAPWLLQAADGKEVIPVGMHHGLKGGQPSTRHVVMTNAVEGLS